MIAGMAGRVLVSTFALASLFQTASTQLFGPDPRWLTPDGSQADFSTTLKAGSTLTFSWKTLNSSKSDLWLMHDNSASYPWYTSVAKNVDISVAGSTTWYADVPASTIKENNQFVLRFFPAGDAFAGLHFLQFASPGFYLSGGTDSTTTATPGAGGIATTKTSSLSSATSVQTTGTSTSTGASSSSISQSQSQSQSQSSSASVVTSTNAAGSTVTATVTPQSTSTGIAGSSQDASSSSSNLSAAAMAGIGVTAGIVIVLLFVAGCFFGRRYGIGKKLKNRDGTDAEVVEMEGTMNKGFGRPQTSYSTEDARLMRHDDRPWQKSRTPWAEAAGDQAYPVEKSGAMVRPGLHEVS